MRGAPPSIRLYVLAQALPGVFGGFDVMSEAPELFAELSATSTIIAFEERRRAERERVRSASRARQGARAR